MDTLMLYVLLVLPQVQGVLYSICMLGGIFAIAAVIAACFMYGDAYDDDDQKTAKGHLRKGIAACFVLAGLMLLSSLIPDTQTMYALIAWELGSDLEGARELPSEFVEYLRLLLSEEIKELGEAVEASE